MKQAIFQFLRFCLVGLANTAIGLSTILALMHFLAVPPVPANVVGYAAGLCFSFFANGRWTFRQPFTRKSGGRFFLAFAVSYALNLLVLTIAIDRLLVEPMIAQICAMVTYTIVFFILSRFYVFNDAGRPLAESAE